MKRRIRSVSGTSEPSFPDDALGELGDDKLTEIAGLLGTDTDGARDTVTETV